MKASELFDTIAGIRQRDGVTVMLVEQNAALSLSVSVVVVVQGRVAMTDQKACMLANSQVSELYVGGMPTDRAGGPAGIEGWA